MKKENKKVDENENNVPHLVHDVRNTAEKKVIFKGTKKECEDYRAKKFASNIHGKLEIMSQEAYDKLYKLTPEQVAEKVLQSMNVIETELGLLTKEEKQEAFAILQTDERFLKAMKSFM